jgi:hypothetical protein
LTGGGVNLTITNKLDRLAYRISSRLPQDEFLKLSERAILNQTSTSELVRKIIQEALNAAEGRAVTPEASTISLVALLRPTLSLALRKGNVLISLSHPDPNLAAGGSRWRIGSAAKSSAFGR